MCYAYSTPYKYYLHCCWDSLSHNKDVETHYHTDAHVQTHIEKNFGLARHQVYWLCWLNVPQIKEYITMKCIAFEDITHDFLNFYKVVLDFKNTLREYKHQTTLVILFACLLGQRTKLMEDQTTYIISYLDIILT